MINKKCLIEGCAVHGSWETGFCPTCRRYLQRVEKLPFAWRLARAELVHRWEVRLELSMARKGTVTHIRSRRHAAA